MAVSFENDIAPMFDQYQANMSWRFDLTNYDNVKANYDMIYGQISTQQMPPPPYTPLSDKQVAVFQQWKTDGFQP